MHCIHFKTLFLESQNVYPVLFSTYEIYVENIYIILSFRGDEVRSRGFLECCAV